MAVPRSNFRHRPQVEALDADTALFVGSPTAVGPATLEAICQIDGGLASSDAKAVLGRRRHDFLVKIVLPDVLVPFLRPVSSGVLEGSREKVNSTPNEGRR